jgi:hypothetical protein
LNAQIDGRYVKVGPCEPKKKFSRRFNREDEYAFKRWGDWNSQSRNADSSSSRPTGQGIEQGPIGALNHFDDMADNNNKGRRLFVGGLPKMINQAEHNSEIADLLGAFNPCANLSHIPSIFAGHRLTQNFIPELRSGNASRQTSTPDHSRVTITTASLILKIRRTWTQQPKHSMALFT